MPSLRTISIVLGSMAAAFLLGIETAGDVKPVIGSTEALFAALAGDLNGNGALDVGDAIRALELSEGYRSPSPTELAADPDQDFHLTVKDALWILENLQIVSADPEF